MHFNTDISLIRGMHNIGLVTNYLRIVSFILLFILWFVFSVSFFMSGFTFCEFCYELTIHKY